MSLPAGTKLGRYEIRAKIGEGGMGEVYLAQDDALDRKVALKILPADLAAKKDRMERFVREAKAAAALNHPNIAHIYEIGESEGVNFIAMEFVDGETLRQLIHGKSTDLKKLLRYLQHTAEALAKAHATGIVHRDLKPDNIMVTHEGHAKILDFGLAKLIEPQLADPSKASDEEQITAIMQQHSTPGVVMGTIGYMSPEQARGDVRDIDHRSDIFLFGCILYEAITGHKAFEGKDTIDSLNKIIREQPAPIATFTPAAPADLQRIVRRCLAKDTEERYQTIKDVAIELKEVRRELQSRADFDTTVPPPTVGASISPESGDSVPVDVSSPISSLSPATVSTHQSSAEYVASQIKHHKKAAVMILAAFVLAAAGLAFALYRFSAKKPAPFQSIKISKLTNIGNATAAQISPNGEYVAHVLYQSRKNSIRVWDVATRSNIEIVPATESSLIVSSFSPDSRYVYYRRDAALYQIASLGGASKKILEDNFAGGIGFSPDGRQLTFERRDSNGDTSLIVANADGTGQRTLTTLTRGRRLASYEPAWSPDGKMIATGVTVDGTNMTIAVVSVENGAMKPVTSQKWIAVNRMVWTPDGKGLVFSAGETNTQIQLWYVSYPGGEARRIINDPNNYGSGSISITADSSTIATIQFETISNVFVAPAADVTRARQITHNLSGFASSYYLSWTPDGKLVYATTASGNRNIWIMNADGTENRQLTNGTAYDGGPAVSPDGRYIFFDSTRSGRENIWRMDIDGSHLTQLTSGGDDEIPRVSPDGRWVVYDAIATSELRKVPIEGGESVRLTERRLIWPTVSPKDGMIAGLYRPDESTPVRLAVFPPEGGAPIKTFDIPSGNRRDLHWSVDGRAILYIISRASTSTLWSQSIDGGAPKQLADFSPEEIFSLALSRDRKWVAFARGTVVRDVILITDTSKK
jgi:eukaryotic-like serine/threonine-protein kinase